MTSISRNLKQKQNNSNIVKSVFLILSFFILINQIHGQNSTIYKSKGRKRSEPYPSSSLSYGKKQLAAQYDYQDQLADENVAVSAPPYPVKESSRSTRTKLAQYDQIAIADETGSTGVSYSARNPRADANYLRNYHYNPRGDSVGWESGRQLSSFGINSLQNLQSSASSSPSDYVYGGLGGGAEQQDNYGAAGGHGQQSYGHSGGQSHGKGSCNSALGLLGVLGLASYLQNVLRQMSTTAAPAPAPAPGRKKRDLEYNEISSSPDDITAKIFPLLMAVGHARDGLVPINCVFRPVCLSNKILTQRLGGMGKPVCDQLRVTVEKTMNGIRPYWRQTKIKREIQRATQAGISGMNCDLIYPRCLELDRLANSSMPLPVIF